MEIPIQVAVRIYPCLLASESDGEDGVVPLKDANGNSSRSEALLKDENDNGNRVVVHTTPLSMMGPGLDNGLTGGVVQVGMHSFPITYALPVDCTQNQIYNQSVFPLINLFLEGFDASVVTYGQKGTGKTYTLLGDDADEQGIIQRCVSEIFAHIANHPERTYAVNIGWVEIYGEVIRDLLGVGNVHCANISEVFHWMRLGIEASNAKPPSNIDLGGAHTLFTLTLEQQWVSKEGLIQHRLSTASFSDLCATERVLMLNSYEQPTSLPKDTGLLGLERVVSTLTDPALLYSLNGNVPYNQTTLTTLLKDSFGGRAQTLMILCVSPLERDINETIGNLQFAFKVQCVRNYVVMNAFSDDNTPVSPDVAAAAAAVAVAAGAGSAASETPSNGLNMGIPPNADHFGLQFAASQWFKLVSNAEGLFSKLMSSNAISQLDKEQIEEWLFLKQECEECLSSSEALRSQKHLGPIQETEEPEEALSDPETSCQQNSDNDSDSESQQPDLEEKIESLMEELRQKTDNLINDRHNNFIENQPSPVMESQENYRLKESKTDGETHQDRKASLGGRRRSIQPGASLSSAEIAMLNRVASREKSASKIDDEFLDISSEAPHSHLRSVANCPMENIQKKLRKLDTDIQARQRQIKEVEQTMQLKQNIIMELLKNSETRSNAKQRFNKKKSKLEAEYEKSKKTLAKAIIQGKEKSELERLGTSIAHIEQRLQDLTSIKHIAGESGQKVKKLQQSIHESKRILDDLQKKVKKEKKQKDLLETELKALREKENKALVKLEHSRDDEERGKAHLKEVQARISHLDHVLREKSENLEQFADTDKYGGEQKDGLRHEIRNLRRTRDHLVEQRCSLDRKLKREKMLSHREERKLLECDEAIEAIDAAIEFKNELICGHKSIDMSDRLQREKGEQMLMARLNKLSPEEMRTLLYKYFIKVIDLRDSSRKLEMQLMQLEHERDAWEWKERVLSNAVRQARLEGERNAVLLQRQHEMKLTLMLRHMAEETSASSTSFSDYSLSQPQHHLLRHANLALAQHGIASTSSQYSDSEFDLDFYKDPLPMAARATNKMLKLHKHGELEICPPLPDAFTKYKPLDKLKDKERETKNKLLAKFQVLARYAGHSSVGASQLQDELALPPTSPSGVVATTGGGAGGGGGSKKLKEKELTTAIAAIPHENLKRLVTAPPATKVTRQKNKIIIQDASRKN